MADDGSRDRRAVRARPERLRRRPQRSGASGCARRATRPLAAEVAKLRRPTPAAWAVNQLARRHRAEVEELVRLGEVLRAAQDEALAGGEPATCARPAGPAGMPSPAWPSGPRPLLDERGGGGGAHAGEVTATLEAASLDEEAGAAVLAGRLTDELQPPSGFGVFDLTGAGAAARAEAARPAPAERSRRTGRRGPGRRPRRRSPRPGGAGRSSRPRPGRPWSVSRAAGRRSREAEAEIGPAGGPARGASAGCGRPCGKPSWPRTPRRGPRTPPPGRRERARRRPAAGRAHRR